MICPKCGMEFKDGIEICTDCGTKLVEDLKEAASEMTPLLSLPAEYVERMCAYLTYSEITAKTVPNEDVDGEKVLLVSSSQKELAAKHASVFLSQEPLTDYIEENVDEEDPHTPIYSGSAPEAPIQQKTASERYDEAVSTATTFGACAIVLAVAIFDQFVTHFLPKGSIMTSIILIGITLAMAFGSLKYFSNAKKLQKKALEEENVQVDIRTWLRSSTISNTVHDLMTEQLGSQLEELLIEREQLVLGALREQFPDANLALLESEAERFLNELDEHMEKDDSEEEAGTEEV